ncbi:MAG: hypothetical protein RLY35_38 [Bacteroidota bacterium]|jgi:hypothetical protein
MKKSILFFVLASIMFGACGTFQFTSRRVEVGNSNIQTVPMVADLRIDFSKKVTSYSSWMKTTSEAKGDAYLKAITENNIDVLVDPIYKVESKPRFLFFFRRSQATVYGFAGMYENPRSKVTFINDLGTLDKENIEKYNLVMAGSAPSSGEFGSAPKVRKGILGFFKK